MKEALTERCKRRCVEQVRTIIGPHTPAPCPFPLGVGLSWQGAPPAWLPEECHGEQGFSPRNHLRKAWEMTLAYILGLELVSTLHHIVCFTVATVVLNSLHMEALNSNKVQL